MENLNEIRSQSGINTSIHRSSFNFSRFTDTVSILSDKQIS